MKYPNNKDAELLKSWNIDPKSLPVKIYTPSGFYEQEKKKGVPTDAPFSIRPKDIDDSDWAITFSIDPNSAPGVLISRVVGALQKSDKNYTIEDIISAIKKED
ncbi:MAG TPA: hypothetical protein DHN29_17415, partial [Cytophagales bacterium]|nr:hypothetical protein [Cytophagales bacterium]